LHGPLPVSEAPERQIGTDFGEMKVVSLGSLYHTIYLRKPIFFCIPYILKCLFSLDQEPEHARYPVHHPKRGEFPMLETIDQIKKATDSNTQP